METVETMETIEEVEAVEAMETVSADADHKARAEYGSVGGH